MSQFFDGWMGEKKKPGNSMSCAQIDRGQSGFIVWHRPAECDGHRSHSVALLAKVLWQVGIPEKTKE